jgi:hypothetical protein
MNAKTLQNLTHLYAEYPGCIDLIAFKEKCLQPGQIDDLVHQYIEEVRIKIKLRSAIITALKTYLENTGSSDISLDSLHGCYMASPNQPRKLKREEMRDILVELSSPLTGYLGRKKGEDGIDLFYFLRDLPIDLKP